jgi:DNA primase
MTSQAKTTAQLNFKQIRAAANVADVLEHLDLLAGMTERQTKRGVELVGWCPMGTKKHGDKDSFSVNRDEKIFQCFACKSTGTILDLVKVVLELHIRDAAALVAEITAKGSPAPQDASEAHTATPEGNPAPEAPAMAIYTFEAALEAHTRGELGNDLDNLVVVDLEQFVELMRSAAEHSMIRA